MKIPSRRGVTIVELLIAMVIAAVLGGATISLMLSQNRFTERTEGQRSGRRVGRSAVNALTNDLRMVDPSWGIEAASATSLTVKVPYALGVICASAPDLQTIALLPVDSVALNLPGYSGFATRNSSGVYATYSGGTLSEITLVGSVCTTAANVVPITAPSSAPNQKSRAFTIATNGAPVVAVGTPVMLYRRTQFYFGNSNQSALTGRTALWRNYLDAGTGAIELSAPFSNTAAFRFFNLTATASQTSVPSPLSNIMGFELYLPGQSDNTSRKQSSPEQANLTTAVFLVNRSS